MPRIMRSAVFGSTARRAISSGRAGTSRAQYAAKSAVERQLLRSGLGMIRSVAGDVAADIVGQIVGVRRARRGSSAAGLVGEIAGQALGGVGRAISWLVGKTRGQPQATPAEVRTAREIVDRVRTEAPGRRSPDRSVTGDAPQPIPGGRGAGSTGRGGRGAGSGLGGTGRGGPPEAPPVITDGGGDRDPDQNIDGFYGGPVDMHRVVSSSNVHSFGYDPGSATLYVRYLSHTIARGGVTKKHASSTLQHIHVAKGAAIRGTRSGPGPLYAYFNVPQKVYERMRAAVSKGTFVWDELRVRGSIYRHKFAYRLVAAGRAMLTGTNAQGRRQFVNYVPRRAVKSGFRSRYVTTAGGTTIQSNMTKSTSRKARLAAARSVGF